MNKSSFVLDYEMIANTCSPVSVKMEPLVLPLPFSYEKQLIPHSL